MRLFCQLLVRKAASGDDQGGRRRGGSLDSQGLHVALLAVRHDTADRLHRSQGSLSTAHAPTAHALIAVVRRRQSFPLHHYSPDNSPDEASPAGSASGVFGHQVAGALW